MPTYIFRNKTTGVEWEKDMRISELDTYKKENNAEIMIKTVNIASGQGDNVNTGASSQERSVTLMEIGA